MIEVIRPGLLTTVQDLGRVGYAHLGVARSGALDGPALVRANRLVGNDEAAAGLETTLTGAAFRAEVSTVVAVTGALAPITVDGSPVPFDDAFTVAAGSVVEIGATRTGVRCYVAFAGGITVKAVLGSRATDTLSGLGPPPLRAGHVLPLGRSAPLPLAQPGTVDMDNGSDHGPLPADDTQAVLRVRIRLGPRHDWFSATARDTVLTNPYTLTVKSNRVGARLAGPSLSRVVAGELPSEGIVLGAVQVPSDGQPLVFLADHPTTGGYPIIGVVEPADLPLLAQARPGAALTFVRVGVGVGVGLDSNNDEWGLSHGSER